VKRRIEKDKLNSDVDSEEEEDEEDFIDHGYDAHGDEALYTQSYSDIISQLGFSRGPTSVKTYRELGGKMNQEEEKALRTLERDWERADTGGTGSFLELTKEEARTHIRAKKTDAEEVRREREEKQRKSDSGRNRT
jgi:hypothetical protein